MFEMVCMELPNPVPLSNLRHWHCYPRQCGLIHLEQVFDDKVQTPPHRAHDRAIEG